MNKKPQFFYLIENKNFSAKKIGITNDLFRIRSRFGSKWELVEFLYAKDHRAIKRAEQVTLQAIRMAQNRRNYLSEMDYTSGHTETFSADLATKKVLKVMKRSLKESLKIYSPKTRIVTHKLYNKKYGKLKGPRSVETKRRPRATEERKSKRWLRLI